MIHLKRVYESPSDKDETRILVEKFWPRGISKENATWNHWIKEIAPSTQLRKWFNHDPNKWEKFCEKYLLELKSNPAVSKLKEFLHSGDVTFVYSARDNEHNNALALKNFLDKNLI